MDLFTAFDPVSTDAWKEKVLKDLKGKPWEKLMWETGEGFSMAPYYRKEDIAYVEHGVDGLPGVYPYRRGNLFNVQDAQWQIVEPLSAGHDHWPMRLEEAKDAGVHAILLTGIDAGDVWDHLSLADTALHLESSLEPAMLSLDLYTALKAQGAKAEALTGTLINDPISRYAAQGVAMPVEWFTQIEGGVLNFAQSPWFRGVGLDVRYVHEQGGTATQEIAFALGTLVDYLDLIEQTDSKVSVADILKNVALHVSIGTHFFVELSKIRALRMLYAQVVKAYGIEDETLQAPFIIGHTDRYSQTYYDAYNNLLRSTTAAMSAVLGGVQALVVLPFDLLTTEDNAQSHRLARNIQQLLIHEAYAHKVIDPAGGAYYVEQLTNEIAKTAWSLFQDMEGEGGFLAKVSRGEIGEMICTAAGKQLDQLVVGKRSVIGVNVSPNIEETSSESLAPDGRMTTGYEMSRAKLDAKGAERGKRYTAGLYVFGDVKMRQARAQFVRNALGSGGYAIAASQDLEALLATEPDHVIFCAADTDYAATIPAAVAQIRAKLPSAKVFVAGKPEGWEHWGLDGALYRGMDMRAFLQELMPQ